MAFNEAIYNDELKCRVLGVQYDFEFRICILQFPEGACCDMMGAINFVKRIDPKVRCIATYSGIEEDTSYTLKEDEKWEAFHPKGFEFLY